MNDWIEAAAHAIYVAWLADAHHDTENPFDAGEDAAGAGEDWFETVQWPIDTASEPYLRRAWLVPHAYAYAGRLYQAHNDLRRGQRYVDLWLACYHADVDVAAHAHAVVFREFGHGTDDPERIDGMPTPNLGGLLEDSNPLLP